MSSMSAAQTASISTDGPKKSATINLNAKPRPFSAENYKTLLACTLARHPNETRRYAEYHLQRRIIQTPKQNEGDPDISLFSDALDGCFEAVRGEPLPFSPDHLIGDWGDAYDLVVVDTASLARCAARNNRTFASGYLQIAKDPTRKAVHRTMLLSALSSPPCAPASQFSVDQMQLVPLLTKELEDARPK